MKPLNHAERNNAFLTFLLFFIITIGVVIVVVFSSLKVPFADNEQMRSRLLMMQKQKDLSDSFKVAMDLVLDELAEFDKKKEPAIVTKGRVEMKIEKMRRIIRKMPEEKSAEDKSLYNLIIKNLAILNDAKTRIRNLEDDKN